MSNGEIRKFNPEKTEGGGSKIIKGEKKEAFADNKDTKKRSENEQGGRSFREKIVLEAAKQVLMEREKKGKDVSREGGKASIETFDPSERLPIGPEAIKLTPEQRKEIMTPEKESLGEEKQHFDLSETAPLQAEGIKQTPEKLEYCQNIVLTPDQILQLNRDFGLKIKGFKGEEEPSFDEPVVLSAKESDELMSDVLDDVIDKKISEISTIKTPPFSQKAVDEESFQEGGQTMSLEEHLGVEQGMEFQKRSVIGASERIRKGYMDGGKGQYFDPNRNEVISGREVIVVDPDKDEHLRKIIEAAQNLDSQLKKKKFDSVARFLHIASLAFICGSSIEQLKAVERSGKLAGKTYLGDIVRNQADVCRHRSLLMKTLSGEIPGFEINIALVRGIYHDKKTGDKGGHAWLTVQIGPDIYLYDPMRPPDEVKHSHLIKPNIKEVPLQKITDKMDSRYQTFTEGEGSDKLYQEDGFGKIQLVSGSWEVQDPWLGHEKTDFETKIGRQFTVLEKSGKEKKSQEERKSTSEYVFAVDFIDRFLEHVKKEDISTDLEETLVKSFSEFTDQNKNFNAYLNSINQDKHQVIDSVLEKAHLLFIELQANDMKYVLYGKMRGNTFVPEDEGSRGKAKAIQNLLNSKRKKRDNDLKVPVSIMSLGI